MGQPKRSKVSGKRSGGAAQSRIFILLLSMFLFPSVGFADVMLGIKQRQENRVGFLRTEESAMDSLAFSFKYKPNDREGRVLGAMTSSSFQSVFLCPTFGIPAAHRTAKESGEIGNNLKLTRRENLKTIQLNSRIIGRHENLKIWQPHSIHYCVIDHAEEVIERLRTERIAPANENTAIRTSKFREPSNPIRPTAKEATAAIKNCIAPMSAPA